MRKTTVVWIGFEMAILTFVITMPWMATGIGAPGDVKGDFGPDCDNNPNWLGSWCGIMEQDDADEEKWITGITLYETFYSAGEGDENDFNRYIAEITIPWIGIQMVGGNMILYQYSQQTSEYRLYLNDYEIFYYDDDGYSGANIWYVLDFDGDSVTEWELLEKLELNPPGGGKSGYIKIEVVFTDHPETVINNQRVWGYNGVAVQTIEIPFRIDADVYDVPGNNFYWDPVNPPNPPVHVTSKSWFNAIWGHALVRRTDPGWEREIKIIPQPQNVNPALQRFYFLNQNGAGEFSQHPSSYLNNENLEDNNGVVWYFESYQVQNNPPPDINQQPNQWTGFTCENFEA